MNQSTQHATTRRAPDHPAPDRAATLRKLSAAAFALAVLAGIAEAGLSVAALGAEQGIDAALIGQLAVRGVIFTAALTCAWFLARGRRWAWWALLIGLGVVGLASMVLPMVLGLLDGAGWYVASGGDLSAAMPVVRLLHISLVLVGVAAMLRPGVRPLAARPLAQRG